MQDKRLFGMVQPKTKEKNYLNVYEVGCLGKITSFNETNDKRFIINLSGIIRFRIIEELKTSKLYREFKVDYTDFSEDLKIIKNDDLQYDKASLLKKIKTYFKKKRLHN